MLLPFTAGLTEVKRCDPESSILADGHYSRQSPGHREFMPPGSTLVLRNSEGTCVFGWLWQLKRDDGQRGINCSIFRNESERLSSEIILEAEQAAFGKWGGAASFLLHRPISVEHAKEAWPRVLPMATGAMLS